MQNETLLIADKKDVPYEALISIKAGQPSETKTAASAFELFKQVSKLSLVSSAHHIFSTINFFIASKALADFSSEGLEAAGVISPTVLTMYNSSTGFVRSVGVTAGKLHQDKAKHKEIGQVFQQGLIISVLASIGTLAFNFCMPSILAQFNSSNQVSSIVEEYLYAYALIIPANVLLTNFHDLTLALGDNKSFVLSSLFSQIMGAFFGYNLVLGTLGMPKLGPVGYSYATAMSTWTTNLIYLPYLTREKFKKYNLFKKYTSDNKKIFLELLSLGWPIGVMILVEKGIQLIDAVMAGSINQDALAAQEITSQYVFFPIVLAYGLSRGVSIAISKTKELAESKKITKIGIGTSLIIFLPILVVYNSIPRQLVSVFSNNNQLQPYAKNLFIVNTLGGVLDSKRISTTACLRGLKETKFPLKTTTLCLIFSLLISYLLGFQAELGVDGVYLGRNIGLLFASLSVFFGLANKLNEVNLSPLPHYTSIKAYFFSPKLQIADNTHNDLVVNDSLLANAH